MLRNILSHPLTRGMDIDSPQTTELRRRIIQQKPFLWKIYDEWYRMLAGSLPVNNKPILELGSGAGFLEQYVSNLVASEVFVCSKIDVVLNGLHLPFETGSLSAIVMADVLHHLPDVRRFFKEASRCIPPGGVVSMIEPWYSRWSHFIFNRLHNEPMDPTVEAWEFASDGPLSGANQALPWIVFQRDQVQFTHEFPQWGIEHVNMFMPFRYLVSGGISMRNISPGWSFGLWKRIEKSLFRGKNWAMFAHIILRRI